MHLKKDKIVLTFGHTNTDPAQNGYQFLEDISCAYWYSQIFFSALELNLFGLLKSQSLTAEELAQKADCSPAALLRMLTAMEKMGLVLSFDGTWCNTQVSASFLVPGTDNYMGDFFLYRKYMQPKWGALTDQLLTPLPDPPELSYEERNQNYVAAMDTLIRQKADEITGLIAGEKLTGSMIDIGGGTGSLIRAVQKKIPGIKGVLFDIPEVILAAKKLYPDNDHWQDINAFSGDFRSHEFDQQFGLVCMSNFLHAYGKKEACENFNRAVSLCRDDGLIMIHDYFPDRKTGVPQKGALYDLNMMLNTYNGACHTAQTLSQWCESKGLKNIVIQDLSTDTSVLLASKEKINLQTDIILDAARRIGFKDAVPIKACDVVTAAWAREKCRFGCELYGKGLQCPPWGMSHETTCGLLKEYRRGYLLKGEPPGKNFHTDLLSLEKHAFLAGFHKAFVFGAGPCNVCPSCPENGKCRKPHLARPSMEGAGIDVYETARNAGIPLNVVQKKGQYVSYLGLLLVE